ncbi:hypothetical protein KY290_001108 [Solanum tuberosum]|uniref:Protein TIC 214 n=1 Tax=Solanum tuberosum TaxID=4113 RepID=A0ABQ7WLB0_SOLTU|nr:hypothetical protein KY290_001108 [Solanum tuberosum]
MDLIKGRWEEWIKEMPLKISYPSLEGHEWKIVTGFDPKNTGRSYLIDVVSSLSLLVLSEVEYPHPFFTKKLKQTSKIEERVESEEERDVEIERASEMKGTKQEQEGSTEEETWDPDKFDETEEISCA